LFHALVLLSFLLVLLLFLFAHVLHALVLQRLGAGHVTARCAVPFRAPECAREEDFVSLTTAARLPGFNIFQHLGLLDLRDSVGLLELVGLRTRRHKYILLVASCDVLGHAVFPDEVVLRTEEALQDHVRAR
ncbi:unnamed protein product, partial [Ectocarpus sp. 12 AP-2014]